MEINGKNILLRPIDTNVLYNRLRLKVYEEVREEFKEAFKNIREELKSEISQEFRDEIERLNERIDILKETLDKYTIIIVNDEHLIL